METETIVEVKLVQVNFVPTTYEVDRHGIPVAPGRTVIGQLAFGCEFLPDELQTQLRDIIAREYVVQEETE